eukprot:COSAG02_NODE_810_length_16920_cov_466.145286_3_plen_3115_part_00
MGKKTKEKTTATGETEPEVPPQADTDAPPPEVDAESVPEVDAKSVPEAAQEAGSDEAQGGDGEKPHHKKALALSRKTGKAHRAGWSCSYTGGFESEHREAVTRIQKAYRRYQAWKKARKIKAQILLEREKLSKKDHVARVLLLLFNLAGIVFGISGAVGIWYYLINCPPALGGVDIGPQACVNTMANRVLFNIQLAFAALCAVGLRSIRKDRLAWLRGYSFFLLLMVGAQLSVVGMFMLDRSAAVAGMKEETMASLRSQVCTLDTMIAETRNNVDSNPGSTTVGTNTSLVGNSTSTNSTDDGFREWFGVEALCSCQKPGQECLADWLEPRLNKMMGFFAGLILVQIIMAHFAWRFLGLPSGAGTEDGHLRQVKLWLDANDLHLYQKQFVLKGIRSKEELLAMTLDKVKAIGMSRTDMRKFLTAQNESKVEELNMEDHLGLTGWDKMFTSSADSVDDLNINVKIMTKTLYFEVTVLASVGLCMWVLAHDSRTFPPTDDLAVVMASAQMFVTIFLTLETALEMVLSITSRHQGFKHYLSDPWHLLDMFVLAVFWLYQFYPVFRSWIVGPVPTLASILPEVTPGVLSVLRALRVVRPLRTLRLLGDITLVTQCIASASGMFLDAMFLLAFLLSLFAMIGTSSFGGALHYTCVRCDSYDVTTEAQMQRCAISDRRVYEGNTLLTGEDGWVRADMEGVQTQWTTNSTMLLLCPHSLTCAKDAQDDNIFVRCIERGVLEVGEDGMGSRSFDHFFSAFYTMFILLSGDNGMQDLPNAFFTVDASTEWLAWPMFFVASFGLTLVGLNLVLAICCSVFEDIHGALEHAKEQRAAAAEIQQAVEKMDAAYNEQNRNEKAQEGAEGTRGALARVDDGLEELLEGGAKVVMDVAGEVRSRLLDNPQIALGLHNLDAEREKMNREIRENAVKRSAMSQFLVAVGSSKAFDVAVMIMIVFYTLSIMNQENSIDGIDKLWIHVELVVIIFFVLECLMMIFGLGPSKYFRYGENRLDFLVLLCTVAGHVATHQMAALETAQAKTLSALEQSGSIDDINGTAPTVDILLRVDTDSDTAVRVIRSLRILQMFRMTYKYETMREILGKVFKTGSTIIYLLVFVAFVLAMCSLMMMHLVGGGCDEKYNPNVKQLWGDETCMYPDANFESFKVGFFTSYQIMIGEDWSEVMFWYYAYSPIGYYAAPLFMAIWFLVHGVLFSLFVAVLLLNFGMDEEEKMPLQRQQYDAYQLKKKRSQHASLVATQAVDIYERLEGKAVSLEGEELHILLEEAANAVAPEDVSMQHKSLFIFFLNHPVRVLCARVEQHVYFEVVMISLICMSCISVAIEGPGCAHTNIGGVLDNITDTQSVECLENELESFFAAVSYLILGALILELVLRSISSGFVLQSGPSRPYLANKQNLMDFFIVVVILGTHAVDKWVSNAGETYRSIGLVRAMAPMFSLIRNRPLRNIFRAFGHALPLIGTVMVPIVFLMAMMSVVAVDLFGNGKLRRCMATGNMISYLDGEEYDSYNQSECAAASAEGLDVEWSNPPFNFDNAYAGLVTLFKAATAGVMPMHNVAKGIDGRGLAPQEASWIKVVNEDGSIHSTKQSVTPNIWTSIAFFSTYHIVFTFFLMNLFIGVMSVSFSKSTGTIMITTLQRRWMQCQVMVNRFRPYDDVHEEYRPMPGEALFRVRLRFFTVVTNRHFQNFVTLLIVSNCAVLLLEHYPADDSWLELIDLIDIAFLGFYCVEMLSMMVGIGVRNYFRSGWNTFDFLLVAGSTATAIAGTTSGIEGLRALRALRLFLLMQQLSGVMSLIDTVIHSLPPSITVGAIMAVFFYVYAMIGMRTFGTIGIEHHGSYYDDNNNFDSFSNACKLLAQVMLGQNYMWLTADLVTEGHDESAVFLYFASFFVINVLINLNLFAVVVLDNFAAQNPVAQTIELVDLWCFTYAWADLTIGAAACPALQKRRVASILQSAEKNEANSDDDHDDFAICEDTGNVLDADDGSIVTGSRALQFKSKMQRKRPTGVVEINVCDFTGSFSEGGCFHGSKPFVQLFAKPSGRSHPEHTAVQTVNGHGKRQKVEFGDGKGEQFNIYLDERARNVTFEIMDNRDHKKLAQGSISAGELINYTNAIDPKDLTIDLTGAKKRLDEATPEELEAYYAHQKSQLESESSRSPPTSPKSPESPTPPDKNALFFPVVGKLHIEVVFNEGEALPKFGFMGDFNDNQRLKEQGCGLEGWVWKQNDGMHSRWERRWMWLSTVKTLPDKDLYPEIYYNVPKDAKVQMVAKLQRDVADSESKLASLAALPKRKQRKKDTKAMIADEEKRLVSLQNALKKAREDLDDGTKHAVGYYSFKPGDPTQEDVVQVNGWRDPSASYELGPEQQHEVGVYYYREVDDEGEMEEASRRGKLKTNFVPASEIVDILDYIDGSDTATSTHFGHLDRDATRLFDSEFQFTRRAHKNERGHDRPPSVYRCRAMSPEIKAAMVSSLKWLTSGTMKEDTQGRQFYALESKRPGLLPHPPLNDRDLVRVKNNPSLVPLPFSYVRHLLTHSVYRSSTLGNHRLSREWMIYVTFNLEMKCMQDLKEQKGATRRAHIGEYLQELRGLDYHKALRQLCLLHYEKRQSLMYPQQVEEYRHDLQKVALHMIACAIAGWIHGKALPKYHATLYGSKLQQPRTVESAEDRKERHRKLKESRHKAELDPQEDATGDADRWNTYPRVSLWRKRPAAHSVAVVGACACRLESLKYLFRAIKKEKPALLVQQEAEERQEKERVAALSEKERHTEEHQKALAAEREEDDVSSLKKCFKRVSSDADDNAGSAKTKFSNPMMNPMLDDVDDEESDTGKSLIANPMMQELVQADSLSGVSSADGSEYIAFTPKTFRTLKYGIYRSGWDKTTEDMGYFRPGEEVIVLEERGKRARTKQGWITRLTESGVPLLEEVLETVDEGGDEHTLSMVDDANTIVEDPTSDGSKSPLKFANPINATEDSSSDSESDSDNEERDENGKTRRERKADAIFATLFLEHGGAKGFLDKKETIDLLSQLYTDTLQAENTTASFYVMRHFKDMCQLSPSDEGEQNRFTLDAWRKWDASADVVSLDLRAKRTRPAMTKEELYQKQHQATYEEAQRVKQEVLAEA